MKQYLIAVAAVVAWSSCDSGKGHGKSDFNNPIDTGNYVDVLKKKETDYVRKQQAPADAVLAVIDIKLRPAKGQEQAFEDGIMPWISVDSAQQQITQLMNADEIVLATNKMKVVIDYPLKSPASFVLTANEKGFSRKDLILGISKKYHEIYQEEEETATVKTVPVSKRTTIPNRNETDGRYGIWGHDLGDLMITGFNVYKAANGSLYLMPVVQS
jgi:hypothetical protein